ncbi:MAG: RNB domain-containing ribonuclease, partial [Comamonadaceae bacterium]
LSGFDAAYATYNAYQGGMERFWTLKYLQQQGIGELTATVIKDIPNGALVRADSLPLVFPVAGQQERGAHLRVKLGEIDEIALDVHGTVLERLDLPAESLADDDGGDDDEEVAGPIAIAVDLTDSDTPASASSTENAPA